MARFSFELAKGKGLGKPTSCNQEHDIMWELPLNWDSMKGKKSSRGSNGQREKARPALPQAKTVLEVPQ